MLIGSMLAAVLQITIEVPYKVFTRGVSGWRVLSLLNLIAKPSTLSDSARFLAPIGDFHEPVTEN